MLGSVVTIEAWGFSMKKAEWWEERWPLGPLGEIPKSIRGKGPLPCPFWCACIIKMKDSEWLRFDAIAAKLNGDAQETELTKKAVQRLSCKAILMADGTEKVPEVIKKDGSNYYNGANLKKALSPVQRYLGTRALELLCQGTYPKDSQKNHGRRNGLHTPKSLCFPKRKTWFKRGYLGLFVLGFIGLFASGVAVWKADADRTLEILERQGPKKAYEYIKVSNFDSREAGLRFFFNSVHVVIRNKQYDYAEQILLDVLESTTDPLTQGQCYYYLGNIYQKNQNYFRSIDFYSQAQDLLGSLGQHWWNHLVTIEKGFVFNEIGFPDKAQQEMQRALSLYNSSRSRSKNLEKWFQKKYYLESAHGDPTLALNFALEGLEITRPNNLDQQVLFLGGAGYSLAQLGRFDDSVAYTEKALQLAAELNDLEKRAYLLVNTLLVRRCQGKNYSYLIDILYGYIKTHEDFELESHLAEALAWECQED